MANLFPTLKKTTLKGFTCLTYFKPLPNQATFYLPIIAFTFVSKPAEGEARRAPARQRHLKRVDASMGVTYRTKLFLTRRYGLVDIYIYITTFSS